MTSHTFNRLLITFDIPPACLAKLKQTFHTVHYFPDPAETPPPKEVLREVDVWFLSFLRWVGVPEDVRLEDTPNLRLIQLTSGMSLCYLASKLSA